MGAATGTVFGQRDPNLKVQDAQGNNTPDPNQRLSGGQLFARKALSGVLKGVGQQYSNQGNNFANPYVNKQGGQQF
jgi:hypothetical protein